METLTPHEPMATVHAMQRSAKEIENATGLDLDALLRGMRSDGGEVAPRDQVEIGAQGGPSQTHLSHVLAGRSGLSEKKLYALAQVLGVTVAECRRAYSVTMQAARRANSGPPV